MSSENMDDAGVMEVTGRVLIGSIIALVVVLILVFLFHIYANWLWHRRQGAIDSSNARRLHAGVAVLRRGLDPAFLNTLPVSQFDSKEFKDGLECSVCLSELEDGEKTRVLPKCSHVFHAECIDMWFHSHSTCPVCRSPVSDQTDVSVESLIEHHPTQTSIGDSQSHTLPTNVLFWGDEMEVSTLTSQLVEANSNHQTPILPFEPASSSSSSSSSSSQSQTTVNNDRLKPDLVIDIPRQASEEEGERTPIMRSLRRILSTSRRFNPFSPGSEQGQN